MYLEGHGNLLKTDNINMIIKEENLDLNEKTKKELTERMKNPRFVSHEEAKKIIVLKKHLLW